MENNKSAFDTFELNISDNILGYLKETANWAYFLSILGFIGIGLMVIFGSLFGTFMAALSGASAYQTGLTAGVGFVYVVLALVYFFPVYYLFNFSRKMKNALNSKNNEAFISAFSNLKSHYKFVGIFTIVIISIYLLLFLFAGLGASLF